MKLLTKEQHESCENAKACYICKEKYQHKYAEDKNIVKLQTIVIITGGYRDAAHSICNLKYGVSKDISIVFHGGSFYGYHFAIKEVAEEFEKKITCLGENTEKCINFSVPIKKEVTIIDKKEKESQKPYLTDYNLLIAQQLWYDHYQILLINLAEGIHKIKCKNEHNNEIMQNVEN